MARGRDSRAPRLNPQLLSNAIGAAKSRPAAMLRTIDQILKINFTLFAYIVRYTAPDGGQVEEEWKGTRILKRRVTHYNADGTKKDETVVEFDDNGLPAKSTVDEYSYDGKGRPQVMRRTEIDMLTKPPTTTAITVTTYDRAADGTVKRKSIVELDGNGKGKRITEYDLERKTKTVWQCDPNGDPIEPGTTTPL